MRFCWSIAYQLKLLELVGLVSFIWPSFCLFGWMMIRSFGPLSKGIHYRAQWEVAELYFSIHYFSMILNPVGHNCPRLLFHHAPLGCRDLWRENKSKGKRLNPNCRIHLLFFFLHQILYGYAVKYFVGGLFTWYLLSNVPFPVPILWWHREFVRDWL